MILLEIEMETAEKTDVMAAMKNALETAVETSLETLVEFFEV